MSEIVAAASCFRANVNDGDSAVEGGHRISFIINFLLSLSYNASMVAILVRFHLFIFFVYSDQ